MKATLSDPDATELVLALKRGDTLSTAALYALAEYVEALQVCACRLCGDVHGERCTWADTCAECSRHGEEMQGERLCVDCHESEQRAAELDRRDEYAGLSRRDAEYYASGENWRGE